MIPVFLPPPETWRNDAQSVNFGNHVWASNIRKGEKNELTKKSVRSQTAQMLQMGVEYLPIPTCMVEFLCVNVTTMTHIRFYDNCR